MPYRLCPNCQTQGRLLDHVSKDTVVEYYRCETCSHIWTHDKVNHTITRNVTIRSDEPKKPA